MDNNFGISSHALAAWDRCRRKWSWDRKWEPVKLTPMAMLYKALDHVLRMPLERYTGPEMARECVIKLCGERGVDTGHEPYTIGMHYAYLAEVLARAIRQPKQPALERYGNSKIYGYYEYHVGSYIYSEGVELLRYVIVDYWDDNTATEIMHSWDVIGDVCMTELPMRIRVLILGQSRNGKRTGNWTRCWQHPMNRGFRFARKTGNQEGFGQNWKRVFREDSGIGAEAWLRQMGMDGVMQESVREVKVIVPSKSHVFRVMSDARSCRQEMLEAIDTSAQFPMTRSACDRYPMQGVCRYQCCCLGQIEGMEPEDTGMFRERDTRKGKK